MTDELAEQVTGIGSLVDRARRSLYLYVAAQPDAVSREQAATAVGLPLHSAKFNLDRLVAEGLLEVEFRRLTGRTGPGAGRPSKLYRRSPRQLSVSLPERRYELAGDVLAAAADTAIRDGVPVAEAVRGAAATRGRRLAEGAERGEKRGGDRALERTADVLARNGYEPRASGGEVFLANCPFDRLAAEHTELVCGLNLALVEGVIEGLDAAADVVAELAPQPGFCCVKVSRRAGES
jgi:predicted ArsR family transcriptional regulator